MVLDKLFKESINKGYIECPSCGKNKNGYIIPKKIKKSKDGMEIYCRNCKKKFYYDIYLSKQYKKQLIQKNNYQRKLNKAI